MSLTDEVQSGSLESLTRVMNDADNTMTAVYRGGSMVQVGAEFGTRYHIESILGEGGMGRVYKAWDKEIGRTVALKVVRPELTLDAATMERFKRELLLSSKVSQKNILRIHDLAEVDGIKFISMAYVEGEDLHDLLKRDGRLPLDRALKFARQLCAALAAAHAENVVHRDLKPRNILVDKTDSVCISDFGLAKSIEAEVAGMTQAGAIMGTPRYMSPEQVESKPADGRSDIYSFGLILYEMVTGDVPFSGTSSFNLMFARLSHTPKDPRTINPDLPRYIADIILKCLERDPAQRFQNASEILEALDKKSVPGRPRAVARRVKKPWMFAAAIAAAAVVAGVILVPVVRGRWMHPVVATPTPTRNFVAVLPFGAPPADPTLQYEAEGIVEALSTKLFQIKDIHLASTSAVERAAKLGAPEQMARELGVKRLIKGTLQSDGTDLRVVVKIVDDTGQALWRHEIRHPAKDLLRMEDDLYNQVLAGLEISPSNEEMARGAAHPTENLVAYDLYLRARDMVRSRRDAATVKNAIDLYNAAVQKDHTFALAYAGLADACGFMYDATNDRFWSEKALGAAQQAVGLNDRLPEAHTALGSVYRVIGRKPESIAEFSKVLQLAPNSDEGYRRLGSAYLASGKTDAAIAAYNNAIRVNPFYWENYNQLGSAYFSLGRKRHALDAFQRVVQLDPDSPDAFSNLAAAYFQLGDYNNAIANFQTSIQKSPSVRAYSNLGAAYLTVGKYAEGAKELQQAVALKPNDEIAVGNLADAYRWSGDKQKADVTYDKAITLAYSLLQTNPGDASVMSRLGLYYAKRGDKSRALELIAKAQHANPALEAPFEEEALANAILGDSAAALQSLRTAFAKGYTVTEAEMEPDLRSLRNDARFQALLNEFRKK